MQDIFSMPRFTAADFRAEPHFSLRLSHQIAVSSETGVGGSTCLNVFKELLGEKFKFFSAGEFVRQLKTEKSMQIEEFIRYMAEHPELGHDRMCDSWTYEIGQSNNVIAEARLAHIFMPHAFKVRLTCNYATRARRRARDLKLPITDVWKMIKSRDEADRKRYHSLYPGCLWNDEDFDLILDTLKYSPEEIVHAIIMGHDRWLNGLRGSDVLVNGATIPEDEIQATG